MDEDKKKLWKQAIKWPLYSVAVLPVLITGAYLLNQYEKVNQKKVEYRRVFSDTDQVIVIYNKMSDFKTFKLRILLY